MNNIIIIPSATNYTDNPRLWDNEGMFEVWNADTDKLYECFKVKERHQHYTKLSLYAFDSDKLIGVRFSEPLENFINAMTKENFDQFRNNSDLAPFIGCYEYATIIINHWIQHNGINIKHIAHFCGLAVDPDYRKNGLGTTLVQQSLHHLKTNNYQYIVVQTTGDYSRKIMEKFQFEKLGFINYQEYCNTHNYPHILNNQGFGVYYLKL